MFVGPLSPGADSEDSSAHRHFLNRNQTLESPKTSTRRHQTPDKGIGTLNAMCATQEVLKKIKSPFCTDCLRGLFSVAGYKGPKQGWQLIWTFKIFCIHSGTCYCIFNSQKFNILKKLSEKARITPISNFDLARPWHIYKEEKTYVFLFFS